MIQPEELRISRAFALLEQIRKCLEDYKEFKEINKEPTSSSAADRIIRTVSMGDYNLGPMNHITTI